MLDDAQIAVLCDIGRVTAMSDAKQRDVAELVRRGYVARDGDLYELTPKAQKVLAERGAGLNES